uniref:fatty acid amide hydrolase n=2 Tax=Parascaris univalens TaxID=6257 RepID=A0A915ADD7_PARUN
MLRACPYHSAHPAHIALGKFAFPMWTILCTIFASILALLLYRRRRKEMRRNYLLSEVQKRLDLRERSIREVEAKVAEVPIAIREQIASHDLCKLIDNIQAGRYTALQVLRTYQWKAVESHRKTNCITQFIREAEEWAKELDALTADSKYQRPPLFGVPFSIKECISVVGYDQTKGYAQELGKFATEDAVIVQQIKRLGGVPFVLTNVPQSLLTFSCMNPIYGITSNAFAPDRTSGGSSGGEGALIGTGGSIIGIGADVGGSIRYPCHFNGIAGIKPSHRRLSQQGVRGSVPGRPLINASCGPMTRKISETVKFLSIVWSDDWISSRDPYVPSVKWNQKEFYIRRPLRIGYYEDDGWFRPTPSLQRAVAETRSRLERLGYTLIPFNPPQVAEAFSLFTGAVTVDGCRYLLNKFDADLECDGYASIMNMNRVPFILRRIIAFLTDPFYPRIAHIIRAMPRDTSELRCIYERIEIYRHKFIQAMLSFNIDALLCPVQVVPAIEHVYPMHLFATTSYCGIFNLLDFAAGTVCVSKVTEEDERMLREYPEDDLWYKMAKEATKGSVGLPVGIQIAAPPYREETVLRILQDIEKSIEHEKAHR